MYDLFLEDCDLLEALAIQESLFNKKNKEPKENNILVKLHRETIILLKEELSNTDIKRKMYNIRNDMNDESIEFDYENFIRNDKRDKEIEVLTYFDSSLEKSFNKIINNINKKLNKYDAELKSTVDKTDDAGYVYLCLKKDKKSYT